MYTHCWHIFPIGRDPWKTLARSILEVSELYVSDFPANHPNAIHTCNYLFHKNYFIESSDQLPSTAAYNEVQPYPNCKHGGRLVRSTIHWEPFVASTMLHGNTRNKLDTRKRGLARRALCPSVVHRPLLHQLSNTQLSLGKEPSCPSAACVSRQQTLATLVLTPH
jgi:hypothetical protein